jgi:hypothetical protein
METIMSTLVQAVLTAKVIYIVSPASQTPSQDAAGKKLGSSLLIPVLPRNTTHH